MTAVSIPAHELKWRWLRSPQFDLCFIVGLPALGILTGCAAVANPPPQDQPALAISPPGPPVWKPGYEWGFRWESPQGKGTFVWTVNREEIVDGPAILNEDSEVRLAPGDWLIVNGVTHSWRNDRDEPAVMVGVVIGAEHKGVPLRKR